MLLQQQLLLDEVQEPKLTLLRQKLDKYKQYFLNTSVLLKGLLFIGAGINRELPEKFFDLGLELADCCLIGATGYGRIKLTHDISGLASAILDAKELQTCRVRRKHQGLPDLPCQQLLLRCEEQVRADKNTILLELRKSLQMAIPGEITLKRLCVEAISRQPSKRGVALAWNLDEISKALGQIPADEASEAGFALNITLAERRATELRALEHFVCNTSKEYKSSIFVGLVATLLVYFFLNVLMGYGIDRKFYLTTEMCLHAIEWCLIWYEQRVKINALQSQYMTENTVLAQESSISDAVQHAIPGSILQVSAIPVDIQRVFPGQTQQAITRLISSYKHVLLASRHLHSRHSAPYVFFASTTEQKSEVRSTQKANVRN